MNTSISTELSPIQKRGIDDALWSAIGASIFPGAAEESKLLAYDYCKARGLDIMKKPCHIVGMSVKDAKTGNYVWRDVIMPGIAETRITAHRTGQYAGQDAPVFGPMIEMKLGKETHQVPEFCTVTVYRLIQGEKSPTSNTEYFDEACGTTKDGSLNSMWTKRKRGQLSKCAEAGALRKAFPEELGGIITADEADTEMRDVTPQTRMIPTSQQVDPFQGTALEKLSTVEQPAAAVVEATLPSNPATIPATGRQKKDRIERDAKYQSVTEKTSDKGKTFFVVATHIAGKYVEFTTFSESLADSLRGLDKGTAIRITVTLADKDKNTFALEDYSIIKEEGTLV